MAPSSTGPWTTYDTQSRNVTVPPGPNVVNVEGSTNEPSSTGAIHPLPHQHLRYGGRRGYERPGRSPHRLPGPGQTPPPRRKAASTACPIQFSDVPPDNTFYPYIRCLVCRGIMGGYDDGTFRPYNEVTSGQASKMVSNGAGYNDVIPSDRQTFEDVPPGHPFWLWIERLVLHGPTGGIIGGYPCGGPGSLAGLATGHTSVHSTT